MGRFLGLQGTSEYIVRGVPYHSLIPAQSVPPAPTASSSTHAPLLRFGFGRSYYQSLQTAEIIHAVTPKDASDARDHRNHTSDEAWRPRNEYSDLIIFLWLVLEGSKWLVGFLGLRGRIACRRFLTSGVLNAET